MLGFSLFDSQLGVDAAGPAHVRTGAMTRSRAFKGSTTARNINLTKLGQTKHAFMGELHESMLLVLLTFFFNHYPFNKQGIAFITLLWFSPDSAVARDLGHTGANVPTYSCPSH